MPKADLQKFVIISAAVSGIVLFWWEITSKCCKTTISLVKNQLIVKDQDEEWDEDEYDVNKKKGDAGAN